MRLTLIVAATLSLACASMAHAQEASRPMPNHDDYLDVCAQDYLEQVAERHGEDTARSKDAMMAVGVFCQCEQELLPAAGKQVTMTQVAEATKACHAESDRDETAFGEKYFSHLKAALDK